MDQKTYQIIEESNIYLPDHWVDVPIDQLAHWELREAISIIHYKFNLSQEEEHLSNQIIQSLKNNTEFTWEQEKLSILGEAKIQHLLVHTGYKLKCYNLTVFPNSCQELRLCLIKISTKTVLVAKSKLLFSKIKKQFYEFCNIVTDLSPFVLAGLIIIYGLIISPGVLLCALLIAYVVLNCLNITVHEHWVHDLISPKNRIIGFILNYLGYIIYQPRILWRRSHQNHHAHWKTPSDPEAPNWSRPLWELILKGPGNQQTNEAIAAGKRYVAGWDNYREITIKNLPPESQFLEKYQMQIKIFNHLFVLLVFGITNYIFFFVLQRQLFFCYILYFVEYITHYNNSSREEETDHPWYFFLCGNHAYHNTHHRNLRAVIVGSGWLKYFNVQYYYIKLFYNLREGARFI